MRARTGECLRRLRGSPEQIGELLRSRDGVLAFDVGQLLHAGAPPGG